MPATEATWRDSKLMHRIFAVAGVVLTIGTLVMFYKDHARSWKSYQVQVNNIDLKINAMRQEQFATTAAVESHEQLAAALAYQQALAIDPALLSQFKRDAQSLNAALTEISEHYEFSPISVDEKYIDETAAQLEPLSQTAQEKRAAADAAIKAAEAAASNAQMTAEERGKLQGVAKTADDEATRAERAAASVRDKLVAYLAGLVEEARILEDKALGLRKFRSADIDAAKANVDIAIRDNVEPDVLKTREDRVLALVGQQGDSTKGLETLTALTEVYQVISAGRKRLERSLKEITAGVEASEKAYEDNLADLDRLRTTQRDRRETWVNYAWGFVPLPGKKVLTLPILDAFNSPRKIENLWSDGLLQDYSHARVRRFDRCTTCHQSMQKSLAGQPTTPSFVKEKLFDVVVVPPPKDAPPQPRVDKFGQALPLTLEDWLGIRLAPEGLIGRDDATVELVQPKSPAAKAEIAGAPTGLTTGRELREAVATQVNPPAIAEQMFPTLPGLMVGDVIAAINGDALFGGGERGPRRVEAMLLMLAESGKPITLSIRRGLPNPFTSHPRLDLYISDSSPHRMQTFACTVCHEGQGSATDFKWASHTPNDTLDAEKWSGKYGWFDNHHWIFPMFPKRFAESSCIKCHHEVVDLEPSERFPEAPAPKLTHGYHLIRKYGCYGCHDINGFDGPTRRVGPDLRSEPNYFAVAQQIDAELIRFDREQLAEPDQIAEWQNAVGTLTGRLAAGPESKTTRDELRQVIEDRLPVQPDERSRLDKLLAGYANMLKDVEAPGDLRRPGPSLRYLNEKVDRIFLFDWINDPQHFRPSTRMPRFFGLWGHLKNSNGEMIDHLAPELEPIEIRGMIEYFASYAPDQKFDFEQRPTGIDNWTDEEKIARGKQQFEVRGCLACHTHSDFPDVSKYRSENEIVQGPDLTGVGSKFSRERNERGPDWLYSWIKNPTKYHARTVMPNLFLEPEALPGPDAMMPQEGQKWFDPADDIATYLLSSKQPNWQPIPAAQTADQPLDKAGEDAMKRLTLEYLNEAFYRDAAEDYYVSGIPPALEGELKGAEKDLIVAEGQKLTDAQRLKYLGRKTIFKYGCFGCHDIPGFEDAKPIGTGLADWGRKDPSKLAFEHITHYIEHGHGHTGTHAAVAHSEGAPGAESHAAAADPGEPHAAEHAGATASAVNASAPEPVDTTAAQTAEYYTHALESGNRIGFLYQKLKEPRSYDYDKTENKRYNERLRMPQFPFSVAEREAVITFVLGLVADPPREKYIFQPDARREALLAGQQVLEKYNCGGCHILKAEQWKINYAPDEFGEQNRGKTFPYLIPRFSPQEMAAAAKPNDRNQLQSLLTGLPTLNKADALPMLFDLDGLALEDDAEYSPGEIRNAIDLFQPTIIDGHGYMTGQSPISMPAGQIERRFPTTGGTLTKYLLPVVTDLERQVNPNASGSEAYGWLPPPLMGEGTKVQSAWLHDFLLDPYPIRPAVFLRMPKFNMSSAEASALVNYFGAVDNAHYPYSYTDTRQPSRLEAQEDAYVRKLHGEQVIDELPPVGSARRFDDAMKIVTNGNYCVKCHQVADFAPSGSVRAKAPNLADVYRRLRPQYVRDWIANPKTILPYTSMPVNIPYDSELPNLGGVSQELYHGTSIEQVDGLVDLLMNYDQYTSSSRRIADLVTPATPAAEGATPAEGTPPAGEGAPAESAPPAGSSVDSSDNTN